MLNSGAANTTGSARYLVIGAYGCIGAWTIERLLSRGHDVMTLDLAGASDHRLRMVVTDADLQRITRISGDVADLAQVNAAVEDYAVTRIIHLAALQVPFARANPPLAARVNVEGTVNVFEAARRGCIVAPVVYASSVAAFDAGGGLAGAPTTIYGAFKRTNEHTAAIYFADSNVPSIGLRPHTVFGPGRDQGLTSDRSTAMLAAVAGSPYHIKFGGRCTLQYAHDAAEAFVRASELSYSGASVHNLDGPVASVQDIIAAIDAVVPGAARLITAETTPLPFPAKLDTRSLSALLGGPISRPLHDGVASATALYRQLLLAGQVSPPPPA